MQGVGDKIFDYSKLELERMADAFVRGRPFLDEMLPIQADFVLRRMPDVDRLRPAALLLQKHKVIAMVLGPRFMHRKLTVLIDQGTMNLPSAGHGGNFREFPGQAGPAASVSV